MMRLKAYILAVAYTDTLRQIAEDYDLDVVDRRKRTALEGAISASRRCKAEDMLDYLSKQDVKQVCEASGIDSMERKSVLIDRLLSAPNVHAAPV